MIIVIKKKKFLHFLLISFAIIVTLQINVLCIKAVLLTDKAPKQIIVIDAGHGGRDPGTVSLNGTLEKDINLEISKKVKKVLEENNFKVVMTREEDISLYDDGAKNRHRSDISNRIKIVNNSNSIFFLSFHLNSFEESKYSGAQVFYYQSSDISKNLAEILQTQLFEKVDRNNKRKAKPIDTLLLLRETKVPGVIIECGFLSNLNDESLLKTDEYQQKIAEAVLCGVQIFIDKYNSD